MREYREFSVGDKVMVVREPYMDCPFTWVPDMTKMCGKIVTITNKQESDRTYLYNIADSVWNWCGNCFVPLEPEDELPEIDNNSFLSIIHTGGVIKRDRISCRRPRRSYH